MNGHDRRREKKKRDILNAAFELFFHNSYHDIKVEDIAHLAKVSPASIYNFFGTKQALLIETIKKYTQDNMDELYRELDEAKTFHDKLMLLYHKKAAGMEQINTGFLRNIDPDDPATKNFFIQFEPYWEPVIHKIIEHGKAEGVINRQLSEKSVRTYLICVSNAVLDMWDIIASDKALAQDIVGMIYFGLSGAPVEENAVHTDNVSNALSKEAPSVQKTEGNEPEA